MNEIRQNDNYFETLRITFDKYLQLVAEVEKFIDLGEKEKAILATAKLLDFEAGEFRTAIGGLTQHVADTFEVSMVGGYVIGPVKTPEYLRQTGR